MRIVGAGPAGAAGALAALGETGAVELFDPARFPRHKVCGEFLSPESSEVLGQLGVWDEVRQAGPARLERLMLHFGDREKQWRLPEPAFGLSRYALDRLLLERCARLGATVRRERALPCPGAVLAAGRRALASPGNRLFGFKAHYTGPTDDSVSLFFFAGCYAGVSAVEGGSTNVCALAPEALLRAHGFDFDAVLRLSDPLSARLRPLRRAMDWVATAPVVFETRLNENGAAYPAGDALGFIDPFTGSGILNALVTGRLAGTAAARRTPPREYLRQCRHALRRPFLIASLLRSALATGWGQAAAPLIPAGWLFRLTRPNLA